MQEQECTLDIKTIEAAVAGKDDRGGGRRGTMGAWEGAGILWRLY